MQAGFRRYGWLAAIAVAYLYVVPYFPKIHSANELPRVYLVKAIVEDHAFYVDHGAARWGATADVSPWNGHAYSNKAPGASLLAVPAYAVAHLIAGELSLHASLWLCRIVAGIQPTLAFLWLLWGFLARFAPDPDIRRLVIIAYALGWLAMTYSILFYSHQLAASSITAAWILALDVAEGRRRPRMMLLAGFLAGCAPLMDYQGVFAALPVAIHILVKLPRGQRLRGVALAVVGAAPPVALLLVYHALCFGSPWRTGYDASTTFAMYHQHGFLGITALRGAAFWGSLFRIDNGLIALSPWCLLALPGFVALWRRERAIAITCAAVTVIYLLFISSINFWRGGWGVGPRYITEVVPFLLPPVAAQLQAWAEAPRRLGVAAGLIGVGVVIYVLSSATFPYWPDSVQHPLVDVTFRLVADNLVADNLGSALGVPGIAGLIPYLLLTFGLWGATVWRRARAQGLAIAVIVTAAILVTYGQLPHGEPRVDSAYRSVRAAVLDL